MKDNFDLKKFLTENKALQNLNPLLSESKGMDMDGMRKKIREMILAELGNPDDYDYDPTDDYGDDESGYYSHMRDLEDKAEEDRERDEAYLDGASSVGASSEGSSSVVSVVSTSVVSTSSTSSSFFLASSMSYPP